MLQKFVASTRLFIGELASYATAGLAQVKACLARVVRLHAKVLRALAYIQSFAIVAWWHLEDILQALHEDGWFLGLSISVAVVANIGFESPVIARKLAIILGAIAVVLQVTAHKIVSVAESFRRFFGEEDGV